MAETKRKYYLHNNTWYSAQESLYRILNKNYAGMNCVDHSHLVNSMLRTVGIPSIYGNGLPKFNSGSWCHYWYMAYINYKADIKLR
ncbi:MAG: transglutaminase domain-containing protein [Methanobacteriaceae archaeon]